MVTFFIHELLLNADSAVSVLGIRLQATKKTFFFFEGKILKIKVKLNLLPGS